MKNYYRILQVQPQADTEEIRQAFRRLSKEYHPDRHGGARYYEEKFKEINEAYQVLRDPVSRWQYGQDVRREPAAHSSKQWATPDYAAGRRPKSPPPRPKARPAEAAQRQENIAGPDLRTALWSVVLVLVFFMPFIAAHRSSADVIQGSRLEAYQPDQGKRETVSLDIKERIDRRYQREVDLLNEIAKVDPQLKGLDLETGYYDFGDHSVRLSWDVLQLIKEKRWKW